jgi:hypothetical protein
VILVTKGARALSPCIHTGFDPFFAPGRGDPVGMGRPESDQIRSRLTPKNKTETLFVFRSGQGRVVMFRAVVEEAAALASISLFIGMIAVWAQVFSAI